MTRVFAGVGEMLHHIVIIMASTDQRSCDRKFSRKEKEDIEGRILPAGCPDGY